MAIPSAAPVPRDVGTQIARRLGGVRAQLASEVPLGAVAALHWLAQPLSGLVKREDKDQEGTVFQNRWCNTHRERPESSSARTCSRTRAPRTQKAAPERCAGKGSATRDAYRGPRCTYLSVRAEVAPKVRIVRRRVVASWEVALCRPRARVLPLVPRNGSAVGRGVCTTVHAKSTVFNQWGLHNSQACCNSHRGRTRS